MPKPKTVFLTSGNWSDRNEIRITGSLVRAPLVSTVNGKLVAKFVICSIIKKHCNYHRCTVSGELAKIMQTLKRGELVKVAGRLQTSGEVLALAVIEQSTEGMRLVSY
jgi:hypothetical protein